VLDGKEVNFLVRSLVWNQLDERHEIGVLAIADGTVILTACSSLSPLLRTALGGAGKDDAGMPEAIGGALRQAARNSGNAVLALAWDEQLYAVRAGGCKLFHHHGERLIPMTPEKASRLDAEVYRLTIAPGDWFVLTAAGPRGQPNEQSIQEEIAKAPPSAGQLARQLIERAERLGGDSGAIAVALRVS
jgi:hypothetical protein